jgi:hypothetical protein
MLYIVKVPCRVDGKQYDVDDILPETYVADTTWLASGIIQAVEQPKKKATAKVVDVKGDQE